MPYAVPLTCPACSHAMSVTELTCGHCHTTVRGDYTVPGLMKLSPEQMQFVEVFLRCRGNIREVERDLKISYPTVRSRLEQVIQSLGYQSDARAQEEVSQQTHQVLDALGTGELSFDEAYELLREGKHREV